MSLRTLIIFLIVTFFYRPCLAAADNEPIPQFMTLRLAMGIITAAFAWIISYRFPRYDSRIPTIAAICGFFVGFAAGHVIFFILLVAATVGGIGYYLHHHGSAFVLGFRKWNQERLRKMEASCSSPTEEYRRLVERRDEELDRLEDLDMDEQTREFWRDKIYERFEEEKNRLSDRLFPS